MKHKVYGFLQFVIGSILAIAVACSREEKPCVPAQLDKQIIGEWNGSIMSDEKVTNRIEFLSDGVYKESTGLLFGVHDPSVKINWEVKNDSLYLHGKYANSTVADYSFSLLENTCDQITLSLEGLDKLKLVKVK